MKTAKRRLLLGTAALGLLVMGGCVSRAVVARRVAVDSVGTVTPAAKAQLVDGSVVAFPNGARIDSARIIGDGWRFGATFHDSVRVRSVSADSVATLVAFRMTYDPAKSMGMTAAGALAAFFLALAAFYGMCAASRDCFR